MSRARQSPPWMTCQKRRDWVDRKPSGRTSRSPNARRRQPKGPPRGCKNVRTVLASADMKRRTFFAAPILAGLAPGAEAAAEDPRDSHVFATADGIPHTPEAYAALLAKLAAGV